MIHHIDAIYDQCILRPVEPLVLPEGTRVHLRIEEEKRRGAIDTGETDGEYPTLLERMKDFVGTVHNLPPDASVNLDHYLYGTPKRQ
jgi:predicted DNA-binding antitoxin AbrB/MazE fold protein